MAAARSRHRQRASIRRCQRAAAPQPTRRRERAHVLSLAGRRQLATPALLYRAAYAPRGVHNPCDDTAHMAHLLGLGVTLPQRAHTRAGCCCAYLPFACGIYTSTCVQWTRRKQAGALHRRSPHGARWLQRQWCQRRAARRDQYHRGGLVVYQHTAPGAAGGDC